MRRLAPALALLLLVAGCGLEYESAGTTTTTTTTAPPTAVPTGPADIVFTDQKVEGTIVTVDSVVMPAPGFVVLRIDEDGVPGEIIGIGDVLARGVVANVEVPLFVPLTEPITVHARLHVDVDEDGAFTYEPPDDVVDLPATTANGEDATAVASIDLLPPLGPGELAFADQRSDGEAVVVETIDLPAAGFVGIWTSDPEQPGEPDVLVGRSGLVEAGPSGSVTVDLSPPLLESAPLVAIAYVDRDENGVFVPGDDFDPPAQDVEGAELRTTAFVTVVRLTPTILAVEDQESADGDAVVVGTVGLPSAGFVEIVDGADVLATTDLLEAGEFEGLVVELDPALEPGEYDLVARVLVDFDEDGEPSGLDQPGLDDTLDPIEVSFTVTVPEPEDEDEDA